jgi:hypothetical protein
MWDGIKQRHPDMVMEGCSGGRRIDLETVSRFHWHQKSDRWYDSESDQSSLCDANLYLPGGTVNIPTMATDNYGAWSTFGGQFSLGWDPVDHTFPMDKARRQVELYKRIRPFLSGDYYPEPQPPAKLRSALEVHLVVAWIAGSGAEENNFGQSGLVEALEKLTTAGDRI